MSGRPGDFKGTKGKISGAVGHHVSPAELLALTNDYEPLYNAPRSVDPTTGRSYFDVTNRSDNVVHLLPSQGNGATSVNGTIVHSSNHPSYSNFVNQQVAPRVEDAFLGSGGSFNPTSGAYEGPPEAFRAAGNLQHAYNNSLKKLFLGGIDTSSMSGELRLGGDGKFILGYNLLGSYAAAHANRDPRIGIILPQDFTVVMSRIAIIPKAARNKALGSRFLSFVLSIQGQKIVSGPMRMNAVIRSLKGPHTAHAMRTRLGASLRPIRVGPGLLVYLDQAKRQRLLKRCNAALSGK
ncbi:MAG: hypothetical protein AAFR60_02120 [Pseudomonadota bacterium]